MLNSVQINRDFANHWYNIYQGIYYFNYLRKNKTRLIYHAAPYISTFQGAYAQKPYQLEASTRLCLL